MRDRNYRNLRLGWVLVGITSFVSSAFSVPDAINIQGTLQAPGGGPLTGTYVCLIRFIDQEAGGQELGSVTQTIQISESGRFSIQITPPQELLEAVDPGYELAVDVDGDGFDAGDVFPNVAMVHSVPFALRAGNADRLGGVPAESYVPSASLSAQVWSLGGNEAESGHFLGTNNNRPLILRASGEVAFAIHPNATSPNIIGGYQLNEVLGGVEGGVIAGGGSPALPVGNRVFGDYGAVVGGVANGAGTYAFVGGGEDNFAPGKYSSIGGGATNRANSDYATVGGGEINSASGAHSVVAGGRLNCASGAYALVGGGIQNQSEAYLSTVAGGGGNTAGKEHATVSGGYGNEATHYGATVAGGNNNTASGAYSMVAGGYSNEATGTGSFAAGSGAGAVHDYSFVWSDLGLGLADFTSTATNQFAIRASNGVYLARNAGGAKEIRWGEHYRDNGILAWAKVATDGAVLQGFGVTTVEHAVDSGIYTITVTDVAASIHSIIPVANAEVENPPNSADNVRIVSINQTGGPRNEFEVYINNGNWNLVDNDFVFMLTGR